MIFCLKPGTRPIRSPENDYCLTLQANMSLKHLLCSSQHTIVLIPTLGNSSRHWSYLGRSSATRELCNQDIMVTYRMPPSLKDMLVRAKIPQPKTETTKGCTRPNTCQYCTRLSQSGKITNLNNNTTYNTINKGTCQTISYIAWNASGATLSM